MIIIGQTSGKESYEAHLQVSFSDSQGFEKRHYIVQDQQAWVISCKNRKHFTAMNYGMIPSASGKMDYHYQAPVEGNLHPEAEIVKKRIITHPAYSRPIRETRCLVPVDYYICRASDGQPYLIYSMESRPFALAGIFDTWKEHINSKDLYHGFALLTQAAQPGFQEIGIERIPVALEIRQYKNWINPETPLLKVTKYVDHPEENFLNGYPIDEKNFEVRADSKEICLPAGPEIIPVKNTDFGKIGTYLKSFRYKRPG